MISNPRRKNNAIETAAFALNFGRLLDGDAFKRLADALETLAEELPGLEKRQGIRMQFGVGVAPVQSQSEHTDIARFIAGATGEHEWRISLEGPLLTVRCQQYTRYDEVWARAERYLLLCQAAIGAEFQAAEASLQIVDRFDYAPAADETVEAAYDIGELFQPGSRYLTPHAYEAGLLWHVFQGWFDHCDQRRHLHQLNVSSTPTGESTFGAIIDYRGSTNLLEEGGADKQATTDLSGIFAHMHEVNVGLMKHLLQPEKLQKIGMEGQP